MDVILGASEKALVREVVTRMINGERSLDTKTIGQIKLVRRNTLPILLAELLDHDIARGALKHIRTVHAKGQEVAIYERRHLQSR